MAKYLVETDQGKFEIETEEPSQDHPDFLPVGETRSFTDKAMDFLSQSVPFPFQPINEARKDPEGALAALPSNAAMAGGLLGGVPGAAAAGAAGKGIEMVGRKILGQPAVPPTQPTIPSTSR